MLLDSNIIIYAAQAEHGRLRRFIAAHAPYVSVISKVEVLGYHDLAPEEQALLEAFFSVSEVLPLSTGAVDQAVWLRQQRRMSLGDALLAGTALAHGLALVTRNEADFAWIEALEVVNPFE